ncbi:MAG TPA: hypothetical protein VNU19_00790, partial [Candidatus Acidoferrum sp.]|nr:hypothetical protein [Candidatus Acidoferrum sp.]
LCAVLVLAGSPAVKRHRGADTALVRARWVLASAAAIVFVAGTGVWITAYTNGGSTFFWSFAAGPVWLTCAAGSTYGFVRARRSSNGHSTAPPGPQYRQTPPSSEARPAEAE